MDASSSETGDLEPPSVRAAAVHVGNEGDGGAGGDRDGEVLAAFGEKKGMTKTNLAGCILKPQSDPAPCKQKQ